MSRCQVLAEVRPGVITELSRQRLLANYEELRRLSLRDAHTLQHLHDETGARLLAVVPVMSDLPVTLDNLERFAEYLQ